MDAGPYMDCGFGFQDYVFNRGIAALWRAAWIDQDACFCLANWNERIAQVQQVRSGSWAVLGIHGPVAPPDSFSGAIGVMGGRGMYDSVRYIFGRSALTVNEWYVDQSVQCEVKKALCISAIAISRYRLRHSTLPAGLESLAPDFIKRVPVDPMDGRTLRYRRISESKYLLYSVGEDTQDDGGNAQPRVLGHPFSEITDGRDIVWPEPENLSGLQQISEGK
jgi:hypothetical protein